MKVLILGVNGMLGNGVYHTFATDKRFQVIGTMRSSADQKYFPAQDNTKILTHIDVDNHDTLARVFAEIKPDITINCIGLVKQLSDANNPLLAVPVNTILPHRLAVLADATNSRLIHISTDCVFSGRSGNYLESDFADADDLYGRTKYLGELNDMPHAITLRTSIIGHELNGHRSLVNWFLAQKDSTKGYTKAVFSGLPTIELARIIRDYVIPNDHLYGLYHVASDPINKFDLLGKISEIYQKEIMITPSEDVVIDRSLNAERFNLATSYTPPSWTELIQGMHCYFKKYF